MSLFTERKAYKPFEYPQVTKYVDAVEHSYWIHTEFNYNSDINDFYTKLSENEKVVIKRTLLAISQIEVSVKSFWGDIYKHFPKPEFNEVGSTFAECEVRHSRSYSHLLKLLNLEEEFSHLMEVPCIQGRVDYLSKYLKNSKSSDKKAYTLTLALFSLFIENVSLFSQFLIVKSFNKEKNLFKGIDNVIQATQKEETIHALFGGELVGLVKSEYPEWFDEDFYKKVNLACLKAFKAEVKILDWIFEGGELEFLNKETITEFIKDRFNQSMKIIDCEEIFEVDENLIAKTEWFNVENLSETHTDFFHKTPTNYNKKAQSITSEDLF